MSRFLWYNFYNFRCRFACEWLNVRECIALNSHLIFLIHFRRQNSSREQPIAVKLAHSGTNKSSKKKQHLLCQHSRWRRHSRSLGHPAIISNYPINKFIYFFRMRFNVVFVLHPRTFLHTLCSPWGTHFSSLARDTIVRR